MEIYDLTKEKNVPLFKRKAIKKLLRDIIKDTKKSIGVLGLSRISACDEKLRDNR